MEETKETPEQNQAGLLALPEEVFYRHIFKKLEYRDLLRLRRVCKPTKIYANDYIRNNFKSNVREINEENYTLEHFLQANLSTCSIFIKNSSPAFFDDPLVPEFLRLHGDQITNLRIDHFGTFISLSELHFFSSLPNLLHLDIDVIDATERDCLTPDKIIDGIEVPREKSPFPPNFKNLKTLKLNLIKGSHRNDLGYFSDFIEFCKKLEYLKHPLYIGMDYGIPDHPSGPFGCVMDYIKRRHLNHPDQPNLKFYDLEHQRQGHEYFALKPDNLAKLCSQITVKLLNVHADLFVKPYARFGDQIPFYSTPIVSLKNIHAFAFLAELPNLKKLDIFGIGECSFTETWMWPRIEGGHGDDQDEAPKWPNLEILDLMIDSRQMSGDKCLPVSVTENFFKFLFGPEKKREKVRELAIRVYKGISFDSELYRDNLPIPRTRDVTNTCPFVTKLILSRWLGLSEDLITFWEGMPLLEEVELEECEKIGNVAFVGREETDPVFLKLKSLKKVSLKGLDSSPKITDLAFNLVFRHLKVTHFCLTSNMALKSVTTAGIESLLTGQFNNSVEKFPFDGWSLDGVSSEAFMELKQKFRATHML